MRELDPTMAQQVAEAISVFRKQPTGVAPKAVTLVLSDDTMVQVFRLAGRISADASNERGSSGRSKNVEGLPCDYY